MFIKHRTGRDHRIVQAIILMGALALVGMSACARHYGTGLPVPASSASTLAERGIAFCQYQSLPLRAYHHMPYIDVGVRTVGGVVAFAPFLVDFGSTGSSLDVGHHAFGVSEPLLGANQCATDNSPCRPNTNGYFCPFVDFQFFGGGYGPVCLMQSDYHATLKSAEAPFRQAGIIGADFFTGAIFGVDFVGGALYRFSQGCADWQGLLRRAGMVPLSTAG